MKKISKLKDARRIIEYITTFGYRIAVLRCLVCLLEKIRLRKIRNAVNRKKHRYILAYLNKNVSPMLDFCEDSADREEISNHLWSFWWQGEGDDCPELIKLCLDSIRKNASSWDVHVITQYNIREYADLPEYVYDKVEKGFISLTHLSDILRADLLYRHGGVWIDATTFISKPFLISDKSKYWTTKLQYGEVLSVSNCRWNIAAMYCPKGYILASYLRSFLLYYWLHHNIVIDYFLTDYLIDIVHSNCRYFVDDLERLRPNNEDIFVLQNIANKAYDSVGLKSLLETNVLHKLQRRDVYVKYIKSGNLTNYGYIIAAMRKD